MRESLDLEKVNWSAIEELEENETEIEYLEGFHYVEESEINYYFEMEVNQL